MTKTVEHPDKFLVGVTKEAFYEFIVGESGHYVWVFRCPGCNGPLPHFVADGMMRVCENVACGMKVTWNGVRLICERSE